MSCRSAPGGLEAARRALRLLLFILPAALAPWQTAHAAKQPSAIPAWLGAHIGEEDGQISRVVLERARAHYLRKVQQGAVSNPCYFAMDATRPSDLGNGRLGRRFYIICEGEQSFRAISAGHGSGRNLTGFADFSNGKRCARNFGNAADSLLTTGGRYVTAETRTSFKGYYRSAAGRDEALIRSFVQFDGEGEAANARERAIGGHPAQVLKGMCRRRSPGSPYADSDGHAPFGHLLDYSAGRSNGCTSWSAADAARVVPMMDRSTTLYIYPESGDIDAVARAAREHRPPSDSGPYWNASCLREIGTPKFWPAATLGPILARYAQSHPAPPPQPLPICDGP